MMCFYLVEELLIQRADRDLDVGLLQRFRRMDGDVHALPALSVELEHHELIPLGAEVIANEETGTDGAPGSSGE